eukprot:GHVP01040659.1.p1 GENE.GHVP01040659.1~~GHVP01040659.1.p1  ORF type:complete len:112 (-),score=17.19 GHVP01040659.1:1496-1831(-)
MRLSGLQININKSYLDPIEPKPLLGALWRQQLDKTWQEWKDTRTLHALRKFKGKLVSLSYFPGLIATLALKKIISTSPSDWTTMNHATLYVDAADGGYGALLEFSFLNLVK